MPAMRVLGCPKSASSQHQPLRDDSRKEYPDGDPDGNEKKADQMARGLLENTELEPSPPPVCDCDNESQELTGQPEIDGDSLLGAMMTPRPEGSLARDEEEPREDSGGG